MDEPTTLGNYLRAARRRQTLSIERAAEETRIRQDFLMRMESDEFDFLAPTYVRGFLKSYARFLGVEVEPIMSEFDRRFGFARPDATIVGPPRRMLPGDLPGGRRVRRWVAAVVAVAFILLVFAVIGVLADPRDDAPDRNDKPAAGALDRRPKPRSSPTPTSSISIDPLPEESPAGTDPALDAFALSDGIAVEIVTTEAECWVDVTADGQNVFADTIPLDESREFQASSSMKIVLGFPAGVDILINGEDIQYEGGVKPATIDLPEDISQLI